MITRIEALADALAYYHKSHEPDSQAYQNRNPGNLRAISFKHPRDEKGQRVFNSVLDGYQALLFDLKIKCSGQSRAYKFATESTLETLLAAYGQPKPAAKYVAKQITKALNFEVRLDTPLGFFLEN